MTAAAHFLKQQARELRLAMTLESELRSIGFALADGRMAMAIKFLKDEEFDSIWDLRGEMAAFVQVSPLTAPSCEARLISSYAPVLQLSLTLRWPC